MLLENEFITNLYLIIIITATDDSERHKKENSTDIYHRLNKY